MLERGEAVAVQFLPPGNALDLAMEAILSGSEEATTARIARSGLSTRKALTNEAPVFKDAYLVYEARLVKPGKDFHGNPINQTSWIDQGSHRIYFLEISAIQLREDIATGKSQIHWKSLPEWSPQAPLQAPLSMEEQLSDDGRYQKGYTPNYAFPSAGTVAFEADSFENGMAVKYLPPLAEDQVEVDNDRARWPCFFPSSAGMITCWSQDGTPNLMPCGSTAVVSRHPLVIAPCVCYAGPNERYARRASLDMIRSSGKFGCGVPFINETVIQAIRYSGNISLKTDSAKINRAGLQFESLEGAPLLPALPVHFDCKVVGEIPLGTHIMFLGEVQRIYVRADLTQNNPLVWNPWAAIKPVE
jgi:flavin reductase (DIM6/NTAB) family NADH-FMN oxidoreductase RutF